MMDEITHINGLVLLNRLKYLVVNILDVVVIIEGVCIQSCAQSDFFLNDFLSLPLLES